MEKQTLLLLHAALGSKTQLNSLYSELNHHFNIHTFNFEGHGDTASDKEFSIDLFTQNLSDYIIKNKLNIVSIFGYSMGGYVALNYAKSNPEKVNKIFTYGTKFDWTPESSIKESGRLNPEKIEEKIPHYASYLKEVHSANDWKSVLNKTAKMMVNLGNKDAFKETDFKQISTTVLIGIGTSDTMVTIDESEFVTKQLQNSKLIKLENFVHPLEQNDLKKLSEIIVEYFETKDFKKLIT